MTQASGSNATLGITIEKVPGTLPLNPKKIDLTQALYGESISAEADLLESNAMTRVRGNSNIRNGQKRVAGSIPFEASAENIDVLLYLAFGSVEQEEVLDEDNQPTGLYKKTYKRGKDLPSFTLEKGFTDINQYFLSNGLKASTINMTVNAEDLVTGTLDVMGIDYSVSSTTYDANPLVLKHVPVSGIDGKILEAGQSAWYQSLNFTLTNGTTDPRVVGKDTAHAITVGTSDVTGDVTILFENLDMFNKWLNEVETNLELSFTYPNSQTELKIEFPRVKFTGNGIPAITGQEGIVMTLNFTALIDETAQSDVVATVINSFDVLTNLIPS